MNKVEVVKSFEQKFLHSGAPKLQIGDTVKMRLKVAEADKIRVHPFEGSIIRMSGSGVRSSFTVRKISFGVGVERTFPLHSPMIESVTVISKGKVNRAKLYYMRGRVGKQSRVKAKITAE